MLMKWEYWILKEELLFCVCEIGNFYKMLLNVYKLSENTALPHVLHSNFINENFKKTWAAYANSSLFNLSYICFIFLVNQSDLKSSF